MPSPRDLHAQRQQALIDVVGSQYAEACPGSGKTWVIMGRYARRVAEEPRKGIALVSFTNAAIKEISDRSRGNPGLLRSPNFVGTFDAFIHRFIVTPGFTIKYGRRPRYCESWSQLDRDEVRSGVDYLRLDELLFDERGDPSINWSIIEDRRKPGIQGKEVYLCSQAAARVRALVGSGLLSSDAARKEATEYLQDAVLGPLLLRRISARFSEIIVDEGQDCGAEEIAVLQALHSTGMKVFFVADPGQAIFEFRRSTPAIVAEFARTLPHGQRLSGNLRSSPAICAVAGSLGGALGTDTAIGKYDACADPIVVIVANEPADMRRLFEEVLTDRGHPTSDAIVLAHVRKRAHEVAGLAFETSTSSSKLLRIANAIEVLRSHPLPKARRDALGKLEKALVEAYGYQLADKTVRDACDEGMIDSRWLHRSAYWASQAVRLPSTVTASNFQEDLVSALGRLECPSGMTLGPIRRSWPVPSSAAAWSGLASSGGLTQPARLRAATVHSVKGMEFEAVLLVLNKQMRARSGEVNVLDAWERMTDQEAKRVLYVGATRAKRTLALGVTRTHAVQVSRILASHGVPAERVNA